MLINNKIDESLSAHYFGNVGRCYYFLNQYDIAEACYYRSFQLYYKEEHANKFLNMGFISYWLGQVLQKHGNNKMAYFFFSNCIFYWAKHSPHRAIRVTEEQNILRKEIPDIENILKLDNETIEDQCKIFCEKQLAKFKR
jgi:tetratricopeptide (TPR) repeat protein